ncbi:hypothetical protein WME76_12530 [Sorangium sp. So ce119]|uniref:hypothetical protein n=1 Tax=Sorangium sp. So ce119 TaxID=3133279 RepID=UPI003F622E9C
MSRTRSAKLSRYLEKQGRKPLLVAADMQRPAAVEQLKVLGDQLKIPFNPPGESPVAICAATRGEAKRLGRDGGSWALSSSSTAASCR